MTSEFAGLETENHATHCLVAHGVHQASMTQHSVAVAQLGLGDCVLGSAARPGQAWVCRADLAPGWGEYRLLGELSLPATRQANLRSPVLEQQLLDAGPALPEHGQLTAFQAVRRPAAWVEWQFPQEVGLGS